MLVVRGGGRVASPVLGEDVPRPVPQDPVGLCHELGGGFSVLGEGEASTTRGSG